MFATINGLNQYINPSLEYFSYVYFLQLFKVHCNILITFFQF